MFTSILGIICFKQPVYQEVPPDRTSTEQAARMVVAVAVIQAFCGELLISQAGITLNMPLSLLSTTGMVLLGLLVWVITAGLLTFFGRTTNAEMLRVSGFIQIFSLLGVLRLVEPWFHFARFNTMLAMAIASLSLVASYATLLSVASQTPSQAFLGAFLVSLLVMAALYTLDIFTGWAASALL
jgi:hypothetical protein